MDPMYITARLDTQVDGTEEIKLALLRIMGMERPVCVGSVGICLGMRTAASFRQLFVAEKYRRNGHGSLLVRQVCAIAADAGCQTINAVLATRNRGLWPFYARLGFHIAVEYPDGDYTICKVLRYVEAGRKGQEAADGHRPPLQAEEASTQGGC